MKSAIQMLTQLHSWVGTKELSEWETKFVSSLWTTCNQGKDSRNLTGKQIEKLLEVYGRHFGD